MAMFFNFLISPKHLKHFKTGRFHPFILTNPPSPTLSFTPEVGTVDGFPERRT